MPDAAFSLHWNTLGPARLSAYVTRIEHSPAFPRTHRQSSTLTPVSVRNRIPLILQICQKHTPLIFLLVLRYLRYLLLNAVFVSLRINSITPCPNWSLVTDLRLLNSPYAHFNISTAKTPPCLADSPRNMLERPRKSAELDLCVNFVSFCPKSSQASFLSLC